MRWLILGAFLLLFSGCWKRTSERRASAEGSAPTTAIPDASPKRASPSGKLEPTAIFELVNPAVVKIEIRVSQVSGSQGSGFFVTPSLIVTNYHVIDAFRQIGRVVIGNTGRYVKIREIVATDEFNDLAVIRVDDQRVSPLTLSEGPKPKVGERIFALGSPKGLTNSFFPGHIGGFRIFEGRKRIQIDAPLTFGASGGPVVDSFGRVVGVNVSIDLDDRGLNFAVPVSKVKKLVKGLY